MSDLNAIENKVDSVDKLLAAHRGKVDSSTRLVFIVGLVLCIGVGIYFYVGYSWLKEILEPKMLVQSAEAMIMDALPDAREALEKEIMASSDDWAQALSTELRESAPAGREWLEEFIMERIQDQTDQLRFQTSDEFRQFLGTNRATIQEGIDAMKREEDSEVFLTALKSSLEKELDVDMQEQAGEMLFTLAHLNKQLSTLSEGKRLTGEQAMEREALMLARKLRDATILEPEMAEDTSDPTGAPPSDPVPEEDNAAKKDAAKKDAAKKDDAAAKE